MTTNPEEKQRIKEIRFYTHLWKNRLLTVDLLQVMLIAIVDRDIELYLIGGGTLKIREEELYDVQKEYDQIVKTWKELKERE